MLTKSSIKKRTINYIKYLCFVMIALIGANVYGQSTYTVEPFEKVVVNPHIQVTFIKGDEASVSINSNKVSDDKLNIEVKGGTLNLYLDGARVFTKSQKHKRDKWKTKRSLYQGTVVTATITYKTINSLSLRGEETFVFKSPISQEELKLKAYGEPKIYMGMVDLEALQATIYGEGILNIEDGTIENQKTTCYGECMINTPKIKNRNSKVTAYGEGEFYLNVSDNLKVTAYGEAMVRYHGNAQVSKGVILGEAKIKKLQ